MVFSYSFMGKEGEGRVASNKLLPWCATPRHSPQFVSSSSAVLGKGWSLEQLHLLMNQYKHNIMENNQHWLR